MTAAAYLRHALEDAHVVELRHALGGRWYSGHFDSLAALERAIDERRSDGNLYCTLNRPFMACAANRFGMQAMRDDDVDVITRIVFDLDPKRPTGTPSTDLELAAALRARDLVARILADHAWPEPALGMSGNGGHVVYRTSIRNSEVWRRQSAILYAGIRTRLLPELDRLGVVFDVTVRNPARIWRLYGTTNRKGDVATHRPWRRAKIELPSSWDKVKAATIETTAAALTPVVVERPKPEPRAISPRVLGRGDYRTLDVIAWFTAHGSYLRPLTGKHAVRCPWFAEHTTRSPDTGSDTVVWEATDGWPTFHCSHAHCQGRTIRDVMLLWGDADQYCAAAWERPA